MPLHTDVAIDLIPAAAGSGLILAIAANQPVLGLLFAACALAAAGVAWTLAQNPPQHPSLSPWARS